jgi:hypothetical protein
MKQNATNRAGESIYRMEAEEVIKKNRLPHGMTGIEDNYK